MKKIISLLLVVAIILSLSACGSTKDTSSNQNEEIKSNDTFKAGDVLSCPYGDSFKFLIMGSVSGNSDFVTITNLKATKEKEADLNNQWDYLSDFFTSTNPRPFYDGYDYQHGFGFARYIYAVKISGEIDKKYAGKTLIIESIMLIRPIAILYSLSSGV